MVGLRTSHSRPKKVRESITVAAGASPAINNAIIYPSSQGERTPSNLADEIRVIVGPSQASGLFWSLDFGGGGESSSSPSPSAVPADLVP